MPVIGCPCGCMTWLPYYDDPDCIRHRPSAGPFTAVDIPEPVTLAECMEQVRRILGRDFR